MESFQVQTEDQVSLVGEFLPSKTREPKAVVLINPATGTKASYYRAFAEHLTEAGYTVCLWDFRGTGRSSSDHLENKNFKFSDFGSKDIPRMIAHAHQSYPELALLVVGHSAGAQQIGFADNNHLIRGLIAVATSVGYPPYMPLGYRLKTFYFFNLFSPLSIQLKGYVASKRFNIMEDLPKGVYQEWKDWCLKPDYFFDESFYGRTVPKGNYQSLPFPVRVFAASDDPISNPTSIRRFWSHVMSNEGIRFKTYYPEEFKVRRIDHFGFFKKQFKTTIWADFTETLDGFLREPSGS